MAYGELYRFVFDAANGPEVTISVAKKGYTGEVYRRAVGRSEEHTSELQSQR